MEGLGIDWKILIGQLINFAILFYLLKRFAYKPFLNLLKKRREVIEGGIKKAEEAEKSLLKVKEIEVEAREVGERKARELVKGAEVNAEKKKQAILALAENEKEKILVEAKAAAERELMKEKEMQRKEVLERSFLLAEKFLKEKFKPEDDRKFLEKMTSELK